MPTNSLANQKFELGKKLMNIADNTASNPQQCLTVGDEVTVATLMTLSNPSISH